MRMIIAVSATMLLAACSSTMTSGGYEAEYRQLAADCAADGGVLVPIGAGGTGNAESDYACNRRDQLLN